MTPAEFIPNSSLIISDQNTVSQYRQHLRHRPHVVNAFTHKACSITAHTSHASPHTCLCTNSQRANAKNVNHILSRFLKNYKEELWRWRFNYKSLRNQVADD